ncbi:hypothetical protein [Flavobacterium sp.]|uniref:hypothetical protein n=1 Tax=Flavobacterium sp. TaxID=239 RepID=UPI00286D54C2|nr:hypothetical protein [Flavobacterium sp.]
MAKSSLKIIDALRKTAFQLESGNRYEWGHMGSCNCGNLAQTITSFSRAEIQKYAIEKRGDWSEQLIDYCPTSGYPMDMIIEKMIDFGFSRQDLHHLEWLSDSNILNRIGVGFLNRNLKSDTILYMKSWANLLEDELIDQIKLPNFYKTEDTLELV